MLQKPIKLRMCLKGICYFRKNILVKNFLYGELIKEILEYPFSGGHKGKLAVNKTLGQKGKQKIEGKGDRITTENEKDPDQAKKRCRENWGEFYVCNQNMLLKGKGVLLEMNMKR